LALRQLLLVALGFVLRRLHSTPPTARTDQPESACPGHGYIREVADEPVKAIAVNREHRNGEGGRYDDQIR
jgi:hypothetical protein